MIAVRIFRSTTTMIVFTGLVAVVLVVGTSSFVFADSGSNRRGCGSGTFSLTGSMNTARALHTSTLLNTSEVLVAGGIADTSTGVFSLQRRAFQSRERKMETHGKYVGGACV
jgi:hypothetical protein